MHPDDQNPTVHPDAASGAPIDPLEQAGTFGTANATEEELGADPNHQVMNLIVLRGSFAYAIERLKRGFMLQRKGWNGPGQWVAMQVPDEHSKMGLPYLYMSTVDGKLVPWLASQTDLLAEDWHVIGAVSN